MPSLREVQTRMMSAILDRHFEAASDLVVSRGLAAASRLGVYANNARVNFIETLALSFPVIARLVGNDYFRQCGREFHAQHPSRSGDLQHVGDRFAAYLAERHAGTRYEYLADVAALEWAYQESLIAPDAAPFDLARLAAVDAADHGELRFRWHPAVRCVESPFPIFEIWRANQESEFDPPPIDLATGAQRVLIYRAGDAARLLSLTQGEAVFLQTLERGFAAAVGEAIAADSGFDPSSSLRHFVSLQVITDFEPKELP